MEKRQSKFVLGFITAIMPFIAMIICLGIGRYNLSVGDTLKTVFSPFTGAEVDSTAISVIFNVRLPRLILAFFVGAGLSVSGTAFQSLFSNPLATPDTLGVANGASFGAVMTLLFTQNIMTVQIMAMIFGLIALAATISISRASGQSSIIMVIISGMVVSSLFQALVSLAKYVADPSDALPTITYWLMGSMSRANYSNIALGVPLIAVGTLVLFFLRWRLNILSLQEEEAKSLGIDIKKLRYMVMGAATLVTASCVSMCGQVGWVGLLIPHTARILFGSDNKLIIPASIGLGATMMIVIDTMARSVTAAEIPVSILTAIIGAPFFVILLKKTGGAKL